MDIPPGFKFKNKNPGDQAAVNHVLDFGISSQSYGYMDTNVQINKVNLNANVVDSHIQTPIITQT